MNVPSDRRHGDVCVCVSIIYNIRQRRTDLRSLLPLDGVPAAGEAELVVLLRGALDEVRVFEPLLAERALEEGRGRGGRRGLRRLGRLRRRHGRGGGHVPRARRPPPACRRACNTPPEVSGGRRRDHNDPTTNEQSIPLYVHIWSVFHFICLNAIISETVGPIRKTYVAAESQNIEEGYGHVLLKLNTSWP